MTQVPARIALPIGDPNGIGPEIALKTVAAYAGHARVRLTLFGAASVLQQTARQLGMEAVLDAVSVEATSPLPGEAFRPGLVHAAAGVAAVEAASAAIVAAREGRFDAVVAAPHHETAIHRAGIAFSGYPSLVARVCGVPEDSVFLMLVGGGLNIVHVTLHESLQHALGRLTPELVEQAIRAGIRAMDRFGVVEPRIGVFGINPHAGEGGLFGHEDAEITRPAVTRLQAAGLHVDGPQGADTLLSERVHDLYVAMVHDQGHIPIKVLSPNRSSALSIGADVMLSSVGHGCAMDIAGRGVANATAMIETVARLSSVSLPVENFHDASNRD